MISKNMIVVFLLVGLLGCKQNTASSNSSSTDESYETESDLESASGSKVEWSNSTKVEIDSDYAQKCKEEFDKLSSSEKDALLQEVENVMLAGDFFSEDDSSSYAMRGSSRCKKSCADKFWFDYIDPRYYGCLYMCVLGG